MLKVLKFGGSSVADAAAMQVVAGHITQALARGDQVVVVVSALAQVTNQLTALAWYSREHGQLDRETFDALYFRHQQLADQLFGSKLGTLTDANARQMQARITDWLKQLFDELERELLALTGSTGSAAKREVHDCAGAAIDNGDNGSNNRGSNDGGNESDSGSGALEGQFAAQMAQILAHGELASSVLLHLLLLAHGAENLWLDARTLIVTDNHWLQAKPDLSTIKTRVDSFLRPQLARCPLIVIPGFMGGTADGVTTLLGREGSDYSAALLAEALGAKELQIWSDVDGVMEADPRYVTQAAILPHLSYDQAGELATWGGKILYPSTVEPARRAQIPIGIFNTFSVQQPGVVSSEELAAGTLISSQAGEQLWAVSGIKRPLVIRVGWAGAPSQEILRQFIAQLAVRNLELRGLFPLKDAGEMLLITQDHHRPVGGQLLDYAWLRQQSSLKVEVSIDWDLVAIISHDLERATQCLSALEGAWMLPETGLKHSRLALIPSDSSASAKVDMLHQTIAKLYNKKPDAVNLAR